ncbi:hypothetical protein ACFL03_15410 [Thermodesulfobacteriota bacterium]
MMNVFVVGRAPISRAVRKVTTLLGVRSRDPDLYWPPDSAYLLVVNQIEDIDFWLGKCRRLELPRLCLVVLWKQVFRNGFHFSILNDIEIVKPADTLGSVLRSAGSKPCEHHPLHRLLAVLNDINWHGLPYLAQDLYSVVRNRNKRQHQKPICNNFGKVIDQKEKEWQLIEELIDLISDQDKWNSLIDELGGYPEVRKHINLLLTERCRDALFNLQRIKDAYMRGNKMPEDIIDLEQSFEQCRKLKESAGLIRV